MKFLTHHFDKQNQYRAEINIYQTLNTYWIIKYTLSLPKALYFNP